MSTKKAEIIMNHVENKYIEESIAYVKKRNSFSFQVMKNVKYVAACLGVGVLLSATSLTVAVAAGSIPAYGILYSVSPEIAKRLTPINMSCTDNGIKMEVKGVHIQEDTAEIYISMQDMTEDRIDGTIDLFDSYDIHTEKDSMGGCSFIDYNEENGEATFLIHMQHMNGEPITGKKMEFSVSEFLSHKKEVEKELVTVSRKNLETVTDVQTDVEIRGADPEDINPYKFLKENEQQKVSPTEGATLTAYGFVDGKLHVQMHYDDIVTYDNHGSVYLKDADGKILECTANETFWDATHTGSYEEYIFDMEETTQEKYTVWCDVITCKNLTKGDWKVRFPVENE